ncbi:MAG: adenine deaminase [Chitinophagaceae bacterium]
MKISGQIVDIINRRIYPGTVTINDKKIEKIEAVDVLQAEEQFFILPGFVDAHVHIESSMLIPSEFARLAVVHGTVASISDPHEIANVCGKEGIKFMVDNGKTVPFKFNFGVPSCVPATIFETAGDAITADDVDNLIRQEDFLYLSEMMNFPGVLFDDMEVLKKIASAEAAGKPVDGHAPGLSGDDARKYINAGISTDHECFTETEAVGKLEMGMKILIREGSAAKNFEALAPLIDRYPEMMMFCSDDKHPDSLVAGHINKLCARAVAKGIDLFNVLKTACVNPVMHYKPAVGLLREGDPADFIFVKDLVDFEVIRTFIDGTIVAEYGYSLLKPAAISGSIINCFEVCTKSPIDFAMFTSLPSGSSFPVIEALDGQLITNRVDCVLGVNKGIIQSDPANDILKIVVVNRYFDAPVAAAFIKNFGFKKGAIASSVAHDSHNIVAVGVDDEAICEAVNLVIQARGGVSCVDGSQAALLPLPVAGLMSDANGYDVARQYTALDAMAKSLGSTLSAPFMTLSFMALLVIPELKLSDKGLFDGEKFQFVRNYEISSTQGR